MGSNLVVRAEAQTLVRKHCSLKGLNPLKGVHSLVASNWGKAAWPVAVMHLALLSSASGSQSAMCQLGPLGTRSWCGDCIASPLRLVGSSL